MAGDPFQHSPGPWRLIADDIFQCHLLDANGRQLYVVQRREATEHDDELLEDAPMLLKTQADVTKRQGQINQLSSDLEHLRRLGDEQRYWLNRLEAKLAAEREHSAALRMALAHCVDSLGYVDRAHPDTVTGSATRAERIEEARRAIATAPDLL